MYRVDIQGAADLQPAGNTVVRGSICIIIIECTALIVPVYLFVLSLVV
jgi:hypothetical protein